MNFQKETKIAIYKEILKTDFFTKLFAQQQIIDFLESIWELKLMPSTDSRFNDLGGDIHQHIINNDDYDYDTLFLDKLNLIENDKKFKIFVEQVVSFNYNNNEAEILKLVEIINDLLFIEKYELSFLNYSNNGLPQYIVTQRVGEIPIDFPLNTIPFYVDKAPIGYTHKKSSHKKPNNFPSFVLVSDDWDDFGVQSYFDLFYYADSTSVTYIGAVKILHKTELSRSEKDEKGYKTKKYIYNNFTFISEEFCSLGQSSDYYQQIKSIFPKDYMSIFWALQDCAIFSKVEDKFAQHKQFYSLIRDNEVEQILRQEKYIIEGQNIKYRYQFSYKFAPKYTSDYVEFDFKFDKEGVLANRIYAIIGENGVGKSQFITTLPLDLSRKEIDKFSPHMPIFSKIIAVSNSYFDNFTIPKETASFNYIYCGLSKLVKGEKETLTSMALKQRLNKSCKEIQKQGRVDSLKEILDNLFNEDIINDLFKVENDGIGNKTEFQFGNISPICNKISSGQSTLLYIFCDIISNIRYDSLLLFDEPETHLHPNAITALMSAINELLHKYQSYCIISTHSPLIVRELLSKSVYIMERKGSFPTVKRIGLESFGENLSVLTEEIFGNKVVPKYYKKVIQELYNDGCNFDEIINILRTQDIPLSLNLTLFIKNIMTPYEKN